jgi:hypothetical protein
MALRTFLMRLFMRYVFVIFVKFQRAEGERCGDRTTSVTSISKLFQDANTTQQAI